MSSAPPTIGPHQPEAPALTLSDLPRELRQRILFESIEEDERGCLDKYELFELCTVSVVRSMYLPVAREAPYGPLLRLDHQRLYITPTSFRFVGEQANPRGPTGTGGGSALER
jgi:hypothetical protein